MAFGTALFVAVLLVGSDSLEESVFHKGSICNVQERVDRGRSREGLQKDLPSCMAECSRQDSCVGVSVEKTTGKCFIHEVCSPKPVCNTPDVQHRYYARHCVHGQWNKDTHSCDCHFGTFGERCDNAFNSCTEMIDAGYSQSSYHTIYLDPRHDGELYKVRCVASSNGYMNILVARNNGNVSFNRTWNEYANGFNLEDDENYWIGLHAWHVLSAHARCGYMLFGIIFIDGSVLYSWQYPFVVRNETDNFSFTFDKMVENRSPQGSMAWSQKYVDCLRALQNTPFSTWDRNNGADGGTVNCPSLSGSGWWHTGNCVNPCRFLGGLQLEDWENTPSLQRFSMQGVNMTEAASQITSFFMYLECNRDDLESSSR